MTCDPDLTPLGAKHSFTQCLYQRKQPCRGGPEVRDETADRTSTKYTALQGNPMSAVSQAEAGVKTATGRKVFSMTSGMCRLVDR